ncbi:MAG: SH3 domain-containing protein [Nitrospinae bacterium]|nr:SH3 domain-containing protein [Nitrospinota bacterium]
MKKILLFVPVLLLILTNNCFAEYVAIAQEKANIRSGPDKKYDITMTLDYSIYYPLKVIAKKKGWIKFQDYEGDSGWIADFLTNNEKTGIVKVKANVRDKAGKDGKQLWQAQKGETFKILKEEQDWVEVIDIAGNKGWIYKSLLWGF